MLRALFALESAWPPSFDVGTGNCRVDFEVPENRALFTALFRRMQVSGRLCKESLDAVAVTCRGQMLGDLVRGVHCDLHQRYQWLSNCQ